MREEQGFPVVVISGYFDEDVGSKVLECTEGLLSAGKTSLVLDFGQCRAVNSLGVGKLVSLSMKVVEDFQGRLVLSGLKPIMVSVFEFAMIAPPSEIVPDIAAAVKLLSQ